MVKAARKLARLVVAASPLLLAACSTVATQQEQQLKASLALLQTGDLRTSHDLLEDVVNAPAVNGVTDEALFRLSLLLMTEEATPKSNAPRAQALLERLRKEHPESSWAPHATLLLNWLTNPKGGRDRDREQIHRLLRENRELVRENRELRLNQERLKNLDLELENKRKR